MLRECISILYAILRIGQVTLKRLLQQRIFRFFIGGGVALAFNILLISIMIELMEFNTPVLRNVANALSLELSLLFSFFIYRTWVWPGSNATVQEVVWRQIPLYHLSAGIAVSIRILIVFPILDWLGIHYVINTLIGVLLGASINYVISDRFVFSDRFTDF
jgi:dolichol-phosphate mannosyltransferase